MRDKLHVLRNNLVEEGVVDDKQVQDLDIQTLRELTSPLGMKCLKDELFNIDDVKSLLMSDSDLSSDGLGKIRSLVSSIGIYALSEGLITISHVKKIDYSILREILTPSILNKLKDPSINIRIENLVLLNLKEIKAVRYTPRPLPKYSRTALETYFEKKHLSTSSSTIAAISVDDSVTGSSSASSAEVSPTDSSSANHPLRNAITKQLNSDGQNNLDLLCSIDELEREIRSHSTIMKRIGTLHLHALQSDDNLDYLFTLGGLQLFYKYTSSTNIERQAIIDSLNTYRRNDGDCTDKVLEGLHDHIRASINLARGREVAKPPSVDEIVLKVVRDCLSSIDNFNAITREHCTRIKATIKKNLTTQVSGLPEFNQIDNFINYSIEHVLSENKIPGSPPGGAISERSASLFNNIEAKIELTELNYLLSKYQEERTTTHAFWSTPRQPGSRTVRHLPDLAQRKGQDSDTYASIDEVRIAIVNSDYSPDKETGKKTN